MSDRKDPEIDEGVWELWLKKNELRDRLSYERRLKITVLIAICVVVGTVVAGFIR